MLLAEDPRAVGDEGFAQFNRLGGASANVVEARYGPASADQQCPG
jgi:hypothetical protein